MSQTNSKLTIGAINWDCSLPSSTFFGYYATRSLSPAKYRYTTPFYADVLAADKIDYHVRTVAEYEREMQFAIDADIDYFAYCWYGDDKSKKLEKLTTGKASVVDDKVWELTAARKLHLQSSLKNKLKLCAVLIACHPISDAELTDLVTTMREEYYQTAEGKPLVYIFGGYNRPLIHRLRTACAAAGTPDPFIVFMNNGADAPDGNYSEVQGVSAYACCRSGITTYAQLTDTMLADNENRKKYGVEIIPLFTMGWDPSPRIDHPVPWGGYPDEAYAADAAPQELLAGADRLAEWIRKNRSFWHTGHILTYAWNEFEEGGRICPTWQANGQPDTGRVRTFAEIVRRWNEQL